MKCIIIGGGGFIGSHLADALLKESDYKVTVFDRPGAYYLDLLKDQGAKIILGDFLNVQDLVRAVEGNEIIFHLVSTTVPSFSNEHAVFDVETNVIGSLNLLDVAREAGVRKVIFSSSGGTVYGIPNIPIINELHPTQPISSYGITKLTIEKYLHLYWKLYGLDYCILRISNAYGERQVPSGIQGLIPTVISKALRHEEIDVWGNGNVVRDYIYVTDIASGFVRASKYFGDQRIFNISTGIGYSVNDILEKMKHLVNYSLAIKHEPARPYDVPVNILDNCKAKQYLDWKPIVGIEEGLEKTYRYLEKVVI